MKNFDIREGKLVNYNGKSSYVIIPNFITEISEGAFKDNNKITIVFIPDSVKKIGNETFCNCKQLETVILGQGVTKLPNGCFVGCKLLKRINLENVIGIGDFCFKDCSLLADVHLNNIKKIGKGCFENCLNFKDFTFISQLTEIGDDAFEKCNIEYIALDKCEKLGAKAFANCDNLQRISISKKLKQIGDTPFRGCFNVKLLTVCEKQPKILYELFDNSIEEFNQNFKKLNCVKIEYLHKKEFYSCENITEVLVLKDYNVPSECFKNCTNLETVEFKQEIEDIGNEAFARNIRGVEVLFNI